MPGLIVSLRPEQWTKNLLLFAGLVFGGRLTDLDAVLAATAAFATFCALSGATYLVNDIRDRDADRGHPLKQTRPVASGELAVGSAAAAAALLIGGAMVAAWLLSPAFGAIAAAYALIFSLYSLALKHVVIVDVLTIAGGFVLRAVGGAVVVAVPIGPWLLVCTTLLALFLALSKRRHELVLLGDGASRHRRSLEHYSPYLLDQMIAVVTASTVTAYALYTMSPETVAKFHTHWLPATLPFVLYGIFRYLYLLYQRRLGGNPSELLLSDRALLINTVCWICAVLLIIYGLRLE